MTTKHLPPHSRILIVRLSAIGDVVRTLPVAALIRREYPKATLAWLVEEKAAAVLEEDPLLDEIIVFPRKEFAELSRHPLRWPRLWKKWSQFCRQLRSKKFDVVFDFHGALKSGLLGWATRAPLRVGYKRRFVKEGNWIFSNYKITLPDSGINRYERNLALIQPWIAPQKELAPAPIFVPLRDQIKISEFLSRNVPPHPGGKRVILHPGASKRHKRWFADRYAELADQLIEQEGAEVILTWGPNEKQSAEEVASAMKQRGRVIFSPPLTLKQMAELASRADLFVSTDSGPMHIAAAMGVPQISLFGPTDPAINHPNNPKATVLYHKVPCSPCRRGCPEKTCFQQIKVEEVLTASREKLKASSYLKV